MMNAEKIMSGKLLITGNCFNYSQVRNRFLFDEKYIL